MIIKKYIASPTTKISNLLILNFIIIKKLEGEFKVQTLKDNKLWDTGSRAWNSEKWRQFFYLSF